MQTSSTPTEEAVEDAKRVRREKREARRAKERFASIDRAKKMRVARMASPKSDAVSETTRRRAKPKAPASKFHVGCSGWFYWHWRNAFYPAAIPTNLWFSHYAKHFRTVELNAPFYSWPTLGTVNGWNRQAAGKRFVYTVKVNELITHTKRFAGTRRLVQDFGYIADVLGPRMGCFLFQLPPSFRFTQARLKRLLGQLDTTRRNVVEFRHASWWNEAVFAAFRSAGVIFCSCSAPRLPDQLVKTADDVYIRFHGTTKWYRHCYSKLELAIWVARIRASGAREVWAYFNNDRDAHAIANARELLRQLKRRMD